MLIASGTPSDDRSSNHVGWCLMHAMSCVVGYLIHYVVSTGLFISAYLRLVHVTGYEVIER